MINLKEKIYPMGKKIIKPNVTEDLWCNKRTTEKFSFNLNF